MRRKSLLYVLLAACFLPINIHALNPDSSEWELKVVVEKAEIRLEPDTKSPVVTTALKGTILKSHEKAGEWFRVIIGPDEKGFVVIGFLHSNTVDIIKERIKKEPEFWKEEPEFFKERGLRVKLSGGLGYFFGGDIDKGTRGLYDSTADFLSSAGYTVDKRIESFHSALDISVDFIFYIKPHFGVGLGSGLIRATETNLLIVTGKEILLEHQIAIIPKVSAFPIRLGLYFALPIHHSFSISLNGGTSLYLAKYSYDLATTWDDMDNINQYANAKGFGLHAGIGLGIKLNERVGFLIEGQGRYAKISNFKGKETKRESTGLDYVYSVENGTLYYLEDGKHPYLTVVKEEPSGYKTTRKALFNFSGFTLRAGLIIKF